MNKIFKVGTFTKEDLMPFIIGFFLITIKIFFKKETNYSIYSYYIILIIILITSYLIELIRFSGKKLYIFENRINLGKRYQKSNQKPNLLKEIKHKNDKIIYWTNIKKIKLYNNKTFLLPKYRKITLEIECENKTLYYIKFSNKYHDKILKLVIKYKKLKKFNPILNNF